MKSPHRARKNPPATRRLQHLSEQAGENQKEKKKSCLRLKKEKVDRIFFFLAQGADDEREGLQSHQKGTDGLDNILESLSPPFVSQSLRRTSWVSGSVGGTR